MRTISIKELVDSSKELYKKSEEDYKKFLREANEEGLREIIMFNNSRVKSGFKPSVIIAEVDNGEVVKVVR